MNMDGHGKQEGVIASFYPCLSVFIHGSFFFKYQEGNSSDFSTHFIIATITIHGAKFVEIEDLGAEIIGRIRALRDAEILPNFGLIRERFCRRFSANFQSILKRFSAAALAALEVRSTAKCRSYGPRRTVR
jgi:hypothetical protein